MTRKDKVDTGLVTMYIEGEILYFFYNKGLHLDLEKAKKTIKDRLEYVEGRAYPVLVDLRGLDKIEEEARSYLGSEEAGHLIEAVAVFIDNPIKKILGNFYIKFDKPPAPTKIFTSLSEATSWLQFYKGRSSRS